MLNLEEKDSKGDVIIMFKELKEKKWKEWKDSKMTLAQ